MTAAPVQGGLQHGEDQFRLLVEGVRDYAIFGLDVTGQVISWNTGAERIKGYRPEEILGRHFSVLYSSEDIDAGEPEAELATAAADGHCEAQGWRVRKDGSRFWADVLITALHDDAHQLRGFAKVTRDITERRAAEQALRDIANLTEANHGLKRHAAELSEARDLAELASHRAEEAMRTKARFLAAMNHELRTPMNAVIGMTGLLLDTDVDAVQRDYLETIRASGDALLGIINDILEFSQIEHGALQLDEQPFDLRECVEGALALVALATEDKGLELVAHLDDSCPDLLVGDVTRFRQVIVNLLDNAVKFTSSGEVLVAVSGYQLSGQVEGPVRVTVSVTDTGIGVPTDQMDRLFQPFSQVDSSTTRIYGGIGLGLVGSRRLAEAMGGDLQVTSQVGIGSTFTFTAVLAGATDQRPPAVGPTGDPLVDKAALIVDDNATNRRVLGLLLGSWGMACTEAATPAAALELLSAGCRVDVALLDTHLPDLDMQQLGAAIRGLSGGRDLPLIALTRLAWRPEPEDRALFAATLTKPAKSAVLRAKLLAALAPIESALFTAETAGGGRRYDGPAVPALAVRVLLAEDNPVNQMVAQLILGKLGCQVDTVGNGREAVEAVQRATYDLVLMDVQMPELDGLDATRMIRSALAEYRQPRIVALTAGALAENRAACIRAGMDAYLTKPLQLKELSAILAQVRPRGTDRSDSAVTGAVPTHATTTTRKPVAPVQANPASTRTVSGSPGRTG